jgi:hypothetical protein
MEKQIPDGLPDDRQVRNINQETGNNTVQYQQNAK